MAKEVFKSFLILVAASVFLTSCVTAVHRGAIAMKIDDTTAHVGLAADEVTPGDHVEIFSNKCKNIRAGRIGTTADGINAEQFCEKISKGHGKVVSIINKDYVVVKFDSGVAFQEGDIIEKYSH